MAYDPSVPGQSNQVRGSGDLVKMQANFAALYPLIQSGLNSLLSGGSAAAGMTVVVQGAGSNPQWFVNYLPLSGLSTDGATDGDVIKMAGGVWAPGTDLNTGSGGGGSAAGEYMCHMVMPSGATQLAGDGALVLVTGINTVLRNVGGFIASSGSITVPTGSGYTHVRVHVNISYAPPVSAGVGYREATLQKNGNTTMIPGPGGVPYIATLNRFATITTGDVRTAAPFITPLIPVSGGEVFTCLGRHTQGFSVNIDAGAGGAGTYFNVQAFKLVSGGTG